MVEYLVATNLMLQKRGGSGPIPDERILSLFNKS
jgi:hypothetical protein